jgi:hypothetical protein
MTVHKRYVLFALAYTGYTAYLFYSAKQNESITIGVMFMLCVLWVVGAVILKVLLYLSRKEEHKLYDYVAIFFCTPVPTWIVLGLMLVPSMFGDIKSATIGRTEYFEKDGTKQKQVTYTYWPNSTDRRIESYKQLPNGEWVKDGRWLYFPLTGNASEIIYRSDSIIKQIEYKD